MGPEDVESKDACLCYVIWLALFAKALLQSEEGGGSDFAAWPVPGEFVILLYQRFYGNSYYAYKVGYDTNKGQYNGLVGLGYIISLKGTIRASVQDGGVTGRSY